MAVNETGEHNVGHGSGGDALGAMYVLAAVLMIIAFGVLVLLMFIPSDLGARLRGDSQAMYVPGSGESFTPLSGVEYLLEPAGVRELERGRYLAVIEAVNWSFRPNEIRVPVGSEVTFRARSVEDYHGFALAGTDILLSLNQNEMSEAVHTFAEPGEYVFICSEYCGANHGYMIGRVIVE